MLTDSESTEDDKTHEFESRIKAPIVWIRLECGIRIEDLQEKRFEEALGLIKEYFFSTEVTFRSLNVSEEQESVEEFLANARIQMKDNTSLVAVEEVTGNVIAVMITRVIDRTAFSRTLSRVNIRKASLYSTIMKFYHSLEKCANVHDLYQTLVYLKIYNLTVHPNHKREDFCGEMYKSAFKAAQLMNIDVVVGIFTSTDQQKLANNLGFKNLNEIYYSNYEIDGQTRFDNTGSFNYSAAFMGLRIKDDDEGEDV